MERLTKQQAAKVMETAEIIPVRPFVSRILLGRKDGFKKGNFKELLAATKEQAIQLVERIHNDYGAPKFRVGQPLGITILVQEAFLIPLYKGPETTPEWKGGTEWHPDMTIRETVGEAFEILDSLSGNFLKSLRDDISYKARIELMWAWDDVLAAAGEGTALVPQLDDEPDEHPAEAGP